MNMLVSVIVVTYNSSKFVKETLDSIYTQSWNEIEIIITDDHSLDNTVDICHSWLSKNKTRFTNSVLLTSDINTGVSGNANRGLKEATGKWVKFIGGDDTLKSNCLNDNMEFVSKRSDIKILFSKTEVYLDRLEHNDFIGITPENPYNENSIVTPGRNAESQYKMLLVSDRIHYTPSAFICRDTLHSVGGFDERFRRMEDYPLWLKLTKNGNKLYFMDKITVKYRMHNQAINNKVSNYIINPNYFKQEYFRKIYTYPNLPTDIMLSKRFEWYISQIFRFNKLNKPIKFNRILYSFLTTYLNPFKYVIWLKKIINHNLKHNEFYM